MTKVTNLNLKTKEDFRKFFSAIPANKWNKGTLTSSKDPECHCALGHLGVIDDSSGDYKAPTRQVARNVTRLARFISKAPKGTLVFKKAADLVWPVNDFELIPPKVNILDALKD